MPPVATLCKKDAHILSSDRTTQTPVSECWMLGHASSRDSEHLLMPTALQRTSTQKAQLSQTDRRWQCSMNIYVVNVTHTHTPI